MGPKKNQQKMSLGSFLQDENFGSWADEMEDMPLPSNDRSFGSSTRREYGAGSGTGGMGNSSWGGERRADGYSVREELPLPDAPPYTAHLANLSFDATQDDVQDFFRDCQVTSVRIVEDKLDRKPKGFGYVEFGTLDGLKAALALSGSPLAGRQVRVSVADPPKDRPEQTRDFGDWSRKGPLPDLPGSQRRVSDRPAFGGNRGLDNMSDAGSDRGTRRNFDQGDGKVRDFGNWERRGPLSPAAGAPNLSLREGGRQPSNDGAFRRNSPSWGEGRGEARGEGRSQDGSRPPKREYAERPAPPRDPTASELDNQWRSKMRPDAPAKSPTPETSAPSSPAPAAPAMRPRLNLQKRTVSEADPTASPASTTDSKASPFGAARPVDTATKEKEVEEKRQIAIRQKREADEKARAEKVEEKKLTRDKVELEKTKKPAGAKDGKEDGEEADEETGEGEKPAPTFDVLRRQASGTNDMIADEENEGGDAVVGPTQDKAVKPREIVRDAPNKKANGAWRRGGPPAEKKAAAAAEKPAEGETGAMEEDGWSTVSKSKKQPSNRRNQPTRAIAS